MQTKSSENQELFTVENGSSLATRSKRPGESAVFTLEFPFEKGFLSAENETAHIEVSPQVAKQLAEIGEYFLALEKRSINNQQEKK